MRIFNWIFALGLLFLTASCNPKDSAINSLKDLEGGRTFAVPTGTVCDQYVLKKFPDAQIKYYNSCMDCVLAVQNGKADAAVYDQPVIKNIAAKNSGVRVLPELLFDDQYGFAVQMSDTAMKSAIDGLLAEIKADGTYQDMMTRWIPEKGSPAPMPKLECDGSNGVLKFGTAAVTEPMAYYDPDHNIAGFDIEFAARVACKLGKKLEVIDMEFGAMLPALIAGKVDMIGAGLSITEERAKKVLFSESYYPSGFAAAVPAKAAKSPDAKTGGLTGRNDIGDKRIAVLLGSIHDSYVNKTYPNATVLQYQNVSDLMVSLNTGKSDVAFYDHISLREVFEMNPDLGLLDQDVFTTPIGAGFNEASDDLREKFNAFLAEIKSNGIYDDMTKRWMDNGTMDMPDIPLTGTNGTLKAGIVSDLGMPFTLVKDGQLIGFDIELGKRFAATLGKQYQTVEMPFGSLIASISTQKIDIITASMMITEEREKQIDFSDPYYTSGVSIIARKSDIAPRPANLMKTMDDIADKKVGIYTGTVHDGFVSKKYPNAQLFRFESTADLLLSVKTGKIDAAMIDLITARLLLKHNPELALLTDEVLTMPLGVGFRKEDKQLQADFNSYLKEIRSNGIHDTLTKRWFLEDAETATMPVIEGPKGGKKIVAGVSVDDLPYVNVNQGKLVGFDIEMIQRFGVAKNYEITFVQLEFPSMIAALTARKVDLISDGIAISAERQKQIDFSDSYADFKSALVVLKTRMEGGTAGAPVVEKKPFFKRVSDSFYNNIILEKRYQLILNGLKVTILISIFAALFGTIIGGLVCYMRMAKNKFLSGFASFYIALLRGTPVLVLLMIIYYVVFASININPSLVAVIAFGLNFGAYVSEMFRTSIESIDRGQKEAGIAGGFTKIQTFIYIITPQALRRVLPVYKGEFISLVKMTSIVGYIAVQDLTKASDIIRSRTFDAFFPLIMAAVIYLFLAWLLTWALGYVEISVSPKRKTIKK
jgi:polar amino acid transport system substrate-binding protein